VYSLRDLGNTVIVVEHDEDIMKAADIDIGPEAGSFRWRISCSQGTFDEILKSTSLTAKYLLEISVPKNVENSKFH
jgi:excinuclease ABC subunit A